MQKICIFEVIQYVNVRLPRFRALRQGCGQQLSTINQQFLLLYQLPIQTVRSTSAEDIDMIINHYLIGDW